MLAPFFVLSAAVEGPCDIYARNGSPCVAAHSLTRALYGDTTGPLYAVQNTATGAVMDIHTTSVGGAADSGAQDDFCGASVCIVQRIYDQSPMQNHLGIEKGPAILGPPRGLDDRGVNVSRDTMVLLGGHPVYSAYFSGMPHESRTAGQGYSNRTARGTAVGDQPQSMYVVVSGRHQNNICCFDYGNAENATGLANGDFVDGAMEAVYFGSGYAPTGPGGGPGPWVGADIENGIYEGSSAHATQPSLLPIDFRVAMLKGGSDNHYSLLSGDAQKPDSLKVLYDGPRPPGYEVMHKGGAIVLGIGGDNSPWAAGTFYEGVMTAGYASSEADAAVMANIVAAGYAKAETGGAAGGGGGMVERVA